MKKITAILIAFALLSFIKSQRQKNTYKDKFGKYVYQTSEGRFDGQYTSYYKNGQKKAEGTFENNYRIGNWQVWDSTGRVRMQRSYSDPFTFKRLFPKTPNNKVIDLLDVPQYSIKYNKDGYIEYYKLRERAVLWASRIWRFVPPNENSILFEKNYFFSLLNKTIFKNNITPYKVTDDEFRNELPINEIDTSNIKVIGYKIKEDSFFDNERLVSETRIIGICPVVVRNSNRDTADLYWIYFPEIRKYLANAEINHVGIPTKIKTYDDLLFYRYFHGQIYKELKINDPLPQHKKLDETKRPDTNIEINLVEKEHDIWISLTK